MNVWTKHITFKPKGNKIKIEKNLSKKVLDEHCWVKKILMPPASYPLFFNLSVFIINLVFTTIIINYAFSNASNPPTSQKALYIIHDQ